MVIPRLSMSSLPLSATSERSSKSAPFHAKRRFEIRPLSVEVGYFRLPLFFLAAFFFAAAFCWAASALRLTSAGLRGFSA